MKPSLGSIVHHLETKEMELIVCDSSSTDGTPDAIRDFRPFFKRFKVVSQKSSRGRGRQIAFNHSSGSYIIQFDLDEIYSEGVRRLVQWHKRLKPDYAIIAGNSIYPRRLIQRVGGWRDLNWSEDLDLWMRLTLTGKARWYGYETSHNTRLRAQKEKKQKLIRIKRAYRTLRDQMALHRISLTKGIHRYGLKPVTFLWLLAKLGSLTVRDVVDVSEHSRESIIENNSIDLGLPGEKFVWYPQGLLR